MKKIILFLFVAIQSFAVEGQEANEKTIIEVNGFIPLVEGLDIKSSLKEFKAKFPNMELKEEVKPGVFSYSIGEVKHGGLLYVTSGDFDQDDNLLLIRFVAQTQNNSEENYKKLTSLLDSELGTFQKTPQEEMSFREKGVNYTSENVEYWVSLIKGFGDSKEKSISVGVKIEPLKEILRRKQFQERSEALKSKYGEEFSPFILQGMIAVGMTKEMVIESIGSPKKVNTTNLQNEITEQLIYDFPNENMYVYLKNGVVTGYQKNEK